MGLNQQAVAKPAGSPKPPPGPRNFQFNTLPPLKEPRVPMKYGVNHFLADGPMQRPKSLPNIFNGGDVRQWMNNDRSLQQLPDVDLRTLRSIRAPDPKIERVLQAVSLLRGHKAHAARNTAQRWSLNSE